MEFNTVINTRRSIRRYDKSAHITKEQLNEIIKAAIMAPSWKNSETGRYHIVMSEDKMKELREATMPEYNIKNCADASAIIVTTYVKNRSGFEKDGTPSNELGNQWGAYDLGLQNENFILKAWELGLGTLIMGLRDEKKVREILNIPEEEVIMSIISIGVPDIEPSCPARKEIEDIVKYY